MSSQHKIYEDNAGLIAHTVCVFAVYNPPLVCKSHFISFHSDFLCTGNRRRDGKDFKGSGEFSQLITFHQVGSYRSRISISALCSLTDTHPLPHTLTCVLVLLWGLGVVKDREERVSGWVGVYGRRTPLAPLPFPLLDLSGRRPGSNVEMWLAGVDLIKSARVSLQRGDPRLNHPIALTLFSSSLAVFLFSLHIFFLSFCLSSLSSAAAPSHSSHSEAEGTEGRFFSSLSGLFSFLFFFFSLFADFRFSELFSPCSPHSLCVTDFSFVCEALLSLSLSCTLSPTALSLALSLFLDHCPPTPFLLCCFSVVHVFKAVFL